MLLDVLAIRTLSPISAGPSCYAGSSLPSSHLWWWCATQFSALTASSAADLDPNFSPRCWRYSATQCSLAGNTVRPCSSAQAFQHVNAPIYFLDQADARLWSTVDGSIFANLISSGSANSLSISQTPLSNASIATEKITNLDVQYVP